MILVLRIAGRANNQSWEEETLKRLKLDRKFACIIVDDKDDVRKGMILAVKHMVAFGKVTDSFIKEMIKKRPAKNGTSHLHPPLGGFKKSTKLSAPRGILGRHEDITKLISKML